MELTQRAGLTKPLNTGDRYIYTDIGTFEIFEESIYSISVVNEFDNKTYKFAIRPTKEKE